MRRYSGLLFFYALCLLAGPRETIAHENATGAPPAKAPEMTAEQILDKYVEVTGGRAAYEKLTCRMARGTMEIAAQGLKGDVEIWQKAPNRSLEVVTLPGFGAIMKAYDGSIGWSSDPVQGIRELSGIELASLKRNARFHSRLRWRDLYAKVELVGKEKVRDRESYVVRLTPTEGSPITEYYDTESFLLVRHDATEEGPQGKIPVETYPSDYREVDGIKIPFSTDMKTPVSQVTIKLSSLTHTIEIPDAKFSKPSK